MENKIIHGDCLIELRNLPENSVDSIVTDPPYELGFMGKKWDNTGIANNPLMWKECLRVLKPGGYLLSFGGTRTYHRMASAIEDAGFEVRDMIEWVYGCLSEDTEILTESGYKPLHKLTQYDRIGVYDIENNIYKWERPQRYSVYKVHQDTAYRIKSDYTDQIVSRNHRCLVEREGKLVFVEAWQLNEVEYMPTLPDDFYSLQENTNRKLLLKAVLRKGKGLAQTLFSKWTGKEMSEQRIEVRKEPSLERWSNLLEETRKLQADKICEVSEGVFTDGEKRWICNGTSFDNGSILGDMFRESTSHTSYQSRPTGQPTGKPDVISIKQGTQITRRARVTKIEYSGIIFCPTVSTGAFVARRNGQVFITGNSGFPKSLNIGKAVDKLQGNEREDIGPNIRLGDKKEYPKNIDTAMDYQLGKDMGRITKGTSEWEGWGTALKPAHEPICMARKPLGYFKKVTLNKTDQRIYSEMYDRYIAGTLTNEEEKQFLDLDKKMTVFVPLSVAENCLKWGTGGINIDDSRVAHQSEADRLSATPQGKVIRNNFAPGEKIEGTETNRPDTSLGRFPANLIHDNSEEVRECFPSPHGAGSKRDAGKVKQGDHSSMFGIDGHESNGMRFGDSGNASRFFKSIIYQAKASKSERNKGCEGLEEKDKYKLDNSGNSHEIHSKKNKRVNPQTGELEERKETDGLSKNNHPTVKPIALMEYLIKMVTPKGGIVLDPFAGSGSTLVAAKQNGFNYIGIEMTEEYIPIIEARLK